MIKSGSRVYVWNYADHEIQSGTTDEPVIGTVEVVESDYITLVSIIDKERYKFHISCVHEVGTGPATNDNNIVMEDYYV